MKIHTVPLISALLFLFQPQPLMAHELSDSHRDTVNVVGVGELEAEPDQAILSVSVFAIEPDLPRAKSLADQRYKSVLKVIQEADIDEKQVKVTRLTMQPEYEWTTNKQVYKGERVSRSLTVRINDLEKVSWLMQALVENDVSTVDGLQAGFQDRAKLVNEALGEATTDAKRKADFLADKLDRELGQAIKISEQNNNGPIYRRENVQMAMQSKGMADAAAPDEMFGLQKIRATVNVSFELE